MKRIAKGLIVVLLLAGVLAQSANADSVLRRASRDCYILQANPNDCYCDEDLLHVASDGVKSLIYFGISSIPIGSTVHSATLKLRTQMCLGCGDVLVARIHEDDNWNESTMCPTWNDQPRITPDVVSGPSSGANSYTEIDVTTIVRKWISEGVTNRGFKIEMYPGQAAYYASEQSGLNWDPTLTVDYTENNYCVSGTAQDPLWMPVSCWMEFTRLTGSGEIPNDTVCPGDGEWGQCGFTDDGSWYRVTPTNIQSYNYTFSPPYRDFNGPTTDLQFIAMEQVLPPPDNITVVPGPAEGEVTLSWDAVDGALGYGILYDDDTQRPPWDPNPDGTPNSGTSIDGGPTSTVISGLTPGAQIWLTVNTWNTGGGGDYGDTVFTYVKQLHSETLTPPFSGVTTGTDFNLVTDIGEMATGGYLVVDASTGRMTQRCATFMSYFSGVVYSATDTMYVPVTVPLTGNYRITVQTNFSGGIYGAAKGLIGIADNKNLALVGANIYNVGWDAHLLHNTMDENLTYGWYELSVAALDACVHVACAGITGGVCSAAKVVLLAAEIVELLELLHNLYNQLVGINADPVLILDVALEAGQTYPLAFYIMSQMKGGTGDILGAAVHATRHDWTIEQIEIQQLDGDIGPIIAVSPDPVATFSATSGQQVIVPDAFVVSNYGDQNLVGSASVTSGPISIYSGSSYNIAPGDTSHVALNFTPGDTGQFYSNLSFTGAGGAARSAMCVATDPDPVIGVGPTATVTMDSVILGHPPSHAVYSVANIGSGTLTGSATVQLPFTVDSGGSYALDAGESQSVYLSFSPDVADFYSELISFTGGGGAQRTVEARGMFSTDVSDANPDGLPTNYALHQNYPNPFNPRTSIEFDLPRTSEVQVEVFSILGTKVRTLKEGQLRAGYHRVEWDGKNDAGQDVASGLYLLRMTTQEFEQSRKMMLIR